MKRHAYLLALLLTAALLVGCGHKAQPDADADPNTQAALPPEGITALVLSDDTQVLRFRRDDDGVWRIWKMQLFPLFKCSRYVDWTRYPQKMPKSHTNADGKSDGSGMVYIWGKDVIYPADQPQPPVPYTHFDDIGPCC